MNENELRAAVEYVKTCLRDIHTAAEGRALDPDEQTRWDEGKAFVAEQSAVLARYDEARAFAADESKVEAGATFGVVRKASASEVIEDRAATPDALRSAAMRSLEERVEDAENMAHVEQVFKRHLSVTATESARAWARNLIARSTDVYTSAFAKCMTGREALLTSEERAALSVGSNTNGGFLVPTHLDPTLIITNDGSSNVIRGMARVVTLVDGKTWNGVSSAGVTASFDAELAEVSDDSPTFGRVSIDTHKAQAFAQASIEAFEDINGLASDVLMLFADARDRLEGNKHAVGTGTAEPWGIFTALDANTNVEITSTTAATIGKVDLNLVYRSVPVRWRGRGSWLMNPVYALAIHDLGTAVSASYSGDLREGPAGTILNKPVVESDDAPSTQTTTVRDNEIVFGDFSNYVVVDKPGSMSVEFIPHLFNTSNNLPDGRRGWYAYWRTGADSVNDLAFRLLQDKTSA